MIEVINQLTYFILFLVVVMLEGLILECKKEGTGNGNRFEKHHLQPLNFFCELACL